jgi:murein DD-endopeptidase MepM/ murein hydrolase activator NlpD
VTGAPALHGAGIALGARAVLARWAAAASLGLLGLLLLIVVAVALLGGQGAGPGQIGSDRAIPGGLVPVFNEAARVYDVNAFLLAAIAYQESTFGTGPGWRTVNYAGCVGLMQMCVGGAGGDSWSATKYAYRKGRRPARYSFVTRRHPDVLDAFDNVMAATVHLRGKVAGRAIPRLDGLAYRALCGYYGACSDGVAGNYAHDVLTRARTWQRRATAPRREPASLGGGGLLSWPVRGAVTSPFGMRWGRLHAGIDIGASTGTPIRAAATGRVTTRGWVGGYGVMTCLEHQRPYSTCYAHQSRLGPTASGGVVGRGGLIGYVGCTGHCFGAHLHFEVRVNGSPVDPLPYLTRRR